MTEFRPSATIIADSIDAAGNRLTTMEVRLHLFMQRALNTHRAFSRNSASNRAIPTAKNLTRVVDEHVAPLVWPQEKRGMQGGAPLTSEKTAYAREVWDQARADAVRAAERLIGLGVHKSIANRVLEPFQSVTVIITATDWDDFYAQRLSTDAAEPLAQAEIHVLAEHMWIAHHGSTPVLLGEGQWHLPYLTPMERDTLPHETAIRVSAARCARVSYLTHGGNRDVQADLNLYQRLVTATPPHWSPLEHVATPARPGESVKGNFTGWHQLRHMLVERVGASR